MNRKGNTDLRAPGRAQMPKSSSPRRAERSGNSNNSKPAAHLGLVDRSVLRSGLSYDSFVRALIQTALSRLTI